MNRLFRSFIILFSESIWIYYTIAMFVSVEMDKAVFVNATWWFVAGVAGYTFNVFFAGRVHYLFLVGGNALLLGFMIIQNVKTVVEGSWLLGLVLSLALSFVFIRSGSFVYRESTRLHILQRFEGNIIVYVILASVFTMKAWGNEPFHFTFIFAVFLSLIGMILTLQNHVQKEENEQIEVQRVGRSGWFTAVISLLLLGVSLICTLLFLPSIRETLYTVGVSGFGLLKGLAKTAYEFIMWVFSLFPASEIGGLPPEMTPAEPVISGDMNEEMIFGFSYAWVLGGLGVLVVMVGLVVLAKFLKQWQPPKLKKRQQVMIVKGAWWTSFRKAMKAYFKRLNMKWRSLFPRFYEQTVYWYYNQVQKWGEKNGVGRLRSETSAEYVEKVIHFLSVEANVANVESNLTLVSSLLRKINQDYQATYYGKKRESSEADYQLLLKQLKGLQLSRKRTMKEE